MGTYLFLHQWGKEMVGLAPLARSVGEYFWLKEDWSSVVIYER